MRNRIIHNYEGIDYEVIFGVVNEELPGLKQNLEKLQLPDIRKPTLSPSQELNAEKNSLLPKKRLWPGRGKKI